MSAVKITDLAYLKTFSVKSNSAIFLIESCKIPRNPLFFRMEVVISKS
jgi:hypothetical protein